MEESLKNAEDNIGRLEEEIEQCEGRRKYLAYTSSPSDGSDVRWYLCNLPLSPHELAASRPRMEVVGKGDYFRFGMRDSLAIEAAFLQREEELLSSWWKEFAEASEGPTDRSPSIKKMGKKGARVTELHETEEERVGVPVKGGLYEVDLLKRHCFPVYWNGENRRVLRGHWFARKGGVDWLPVREDVAEQLEIAYRRQVWHRRTFQPSGLFAARVDLQGSTPGLHALFTGEDDTWEAWLNFEASGFSSVIGSSRNGIKLRRGYFPSNSGKPTQDKLRQQEEEEMDDYCSQVPVRHIIFMIHGIGQRLEKSNLVDDVTTFRHITASLAERHLTSDQRDTQRILFIPCQWRKGLKLSGEASVEKITLDGVRGLRVMLSATVHDVLYYMSPAYCQEIINSVSNQLNRLYSKFIKRNPGYDGKVSIYGHSLGSVLSYDILCHQENLSSPFPMDWMYKEHPGIRESPVDAGDQYLKGGSFSNREGGFSVANEPEEKVDTFDDGAIQDRQDPVHKAVDFEEYSREDSVHELAHDSRDKLGDAVGGGYDKSIGDLEKMAAENCNATRNKDDLIKLLRNEVDSLKDKLVELETHCGTGEAKEAYKEAKGKEPILEKSPTRVEDTLKSHTPFIKYTKLEFKVDTFFAVGSPLGVFLALRNVRIGIGKGQGYWAEENISEEMPSCRQMFNIFHPYDPVAYRVEPLVCKEYVTKRPVIIPYHKGGRRLHIEFQEFTDDLASRSHAMMDHLHSVRDKVLTVCQSKRMDGFEAEAENVPQKEEKTYGSLMMERLTGSEGGRVDHMLQDKTFEHPYLQTLGSHTNYWRDHDTALFILKHLYKDIPEDPGVNRVPSATNSIDGTGSANWTHQRQGSEDELSLTFSEKSVTKSFTSKIKKFTMKK